MRYPLRKELLSELSDSQRETLRRATLRGQGVDEAARVVGCSRKHADAMREHLVEIGALSTAPSRGAGATTRVADPRQLGLL
jgi:hypothetical protein